MTSTTNNNFGFDSEGLAVAATFASSIRNRTILVTGVNRKGIGYSTSESFASKSPKTLILAGRSPEKLQECIDDLKATYASIDIRPLKVDLSSQASVRDAAKEVLSWSDVPTIEIIINNAGIMNIQDRTITSDSVELTMATNHVGPFLLTNLLLPKMIAAAKLAQKGSVRLINLSSNGIAVSGVRFSDLLYEKPASAMPKPDEYPNLAMMQAFDLPVSEATTYFPTIAYGASKTAAVLFSVGLNDKLYDKYGILSFAVNPGEIRTELGRNTEPSMLERMLAKAAQYGLKWKTLEQGCSTTLLTATDNTLRVPKKDGTGAFWSDCQVKVAPGYATNMEYARKLWEVSERWTGEKFAW